MKKYRLERAPGEPQAAVIYPPDGSMPAYIPECADYAFRMLQELINASNAAIKVLVMLNSIGLNVKSFYFKMYQVLSEVLKGSYED